MRQQFRLCLFVSRKSFFQHLGNLLVILLPGALEQRLIGRVLDQGMLEEVACLLLQSRVGRESPLPPVCSGPRVSRLRSRGATACKSSYENSRPNVAPSWATCRAVDKRSSRASSASCNVAGIAKCRGGWYGLRP